jgi:integrase
LQYRVGGKKFAVSLKTALRDEAETERARIMDGIRTTNEAQTLQRVVDKLSAARAELARNVAPIGDAWRIYLRSPARPDSGVATLEQYAAEWQRFARWLAREAPGIQTLAQVTERHAMGYAGTLAGMAASTFNQHIGFLALMWRVLDIQPAPWRKIQRKRRSMEGRRELSLEEIRNVFAGADGEMRVLFFLGLYTGLRLGDCCLLRWAAVDLAGGVIRIVPAKTSRSGKRVSIPIHPELVAALGTARDGYVVPGLAKFYLHNRAGVVKVIGKHFLKCGIETQESRGANATSAAKWPLAPQRGDVGRTEERKDGSRANGKRNDGKRARCVVGFHSLRHTFVSLCRQAGAPLAIVEAIVGHSSPAMTRHYTHVGDEASRAAVGMLPSFAAAKPGNATK